MNFGLNLYKVWLVQSSYAHLSGKDETLFASHDNPPSFGVLTNAYALQEPGHLKGTTLLLLVWFTISRVIVDYDDP